MKKNKLIAMGIASLALIATPITNSLTKPQEVQASIGHVSKTSHSITYSNRTGKMTIKNIFGVKGYENTEEEDDKVVDKEIFLVITFTNKTNRTINPEQFAQTHFDISQYYEGSMHNVFPMSDCLYPPTKYYKHLSNNGEDKVAPHSTVTMVLSDNHIRPIYKKQLVVVKARNYDIGKTISTKRFRLSKIYGIDVKTGKKHKPTPVDNKYIMIDVRGMFGKKYPKNRYLVISHAEYKRWEKDLSKGILKPSYIKKKLNGKYLTKYQAFDYMDKLEGIN